MSCKSSRGFTLLEVLITAAILSGAITFVFRSFMAALNATRLSHNISLACYLAEDKIQEMEEKQGNSGEPLPGENNIEEVQGRKFGWDYQTQKLADSGLVELKFNLSWKEKLKEKEYNVSFLTYLLPKK